MNSKIQDTSLSDKYTPSEPCSCSICVNYCIRPGWWTVYQAEKAIDAGLSQRMMLEVDPDHKFGVLSPSFKGNEGNYALNIFSSQGCTFLHDNLCELFNTGIQPLECRYCHHDRSGKGKKCHSDIAKDWNTDHGKRLIVRWGNITGFWQRQGFILKEIS